MAEQLWECSESREEAFGMGQAEAEERLGAGMTVAREGLVVTILRSLMDGKLYVEIDSSALADAPDGEPDIRVYLNDAVIHSNY